MCCQLAASATVSAHNASGLLPEIDVVQYHQAVGQAFGQNDSQNLAAGSWN